MRALDLFKESGRDVLPVYDRDRCTGQLTKRHLVVEIVRVASGSAGEVTRRGRALGGAEGGRG